MQTVVEMRENYLSNQKAKKAELLKFNGVRCKDVYNCSVPFETQGKTYILGRVEKRDEFANSTSQLFEKKEDGIWYKAENFDPLPIEDPFIVQINGEFVVGGTHVVKEKGNVKTYYSYFYRGKDIFNLKYFTTGPNYMKDIRLVQLPESKIGVFSRPRSEEVKRLFGCESMVGFNCIQDLNDLCSEIINEAKFIDGFFEKDEWGGINQAFYLKDNYVGAIGHQSYTSYSNGKEMAVYINMAYIVDIQNLKVVAKKVIGTREDYPPAPSKTFGLSKCAFTSGIRLLNSKEVELYSGLGDAYEGKVIIENPFLNF